MSETTTTALPAAVTTSRGAPETMQSQTFYVTLIQSAILAGSLCAVFLTKDMTAFQAGIAGSVVAGILGYQGGYYYAASKHGGATDAAPTTTTVNAPPATVTTTTGTPP
jgi:drug/metabolite transporter (DMT)-like permease